MRRVSRSTRISIWHIPNMSVNTSPICHETLPIFFAESYEQAIGAIFKEEDCYFVLAYLMNSQEMHVILREEYTRAKNRTTDKILDLLEQCPGYNESDILEKKNLMNQFDVEEDRDNNANISETWRLLEGKTIKPERDAIIAQAEIKRREIASQGIGAYRQLFDGDDRLTAEVHHQVNVLINKLEKGFEGSLEECENICDDVIQKAPTDTSIVALNYLNFQFEMVVQWPDGPKRVVCKPEAV